MNVSCNLMKNIMIPFFPVIEEALRCLSNIYFQSSCAQNYGVENATIPSVIEQVKQIASLI
jgi:hypothetical protein